RGSDRPGRRLRPRVPSRTRDPHPLHPDPAPEDPHRRDHPPRLRVPGRRHPSRSGLRPPTGAGEPYMSDRSSDGGTGPGSEGFQPEAAVVTGPEVADEDLGELHGCPVDRRRGAVVVHCNRDSYYALCADLKADGYAMPIGVTGVDYLTHPGRELPPSIVPAR